MAVKVRKIAFFSKIKMEFKRLNKQSDEFAAELAKDYSRESHP